MNEQIENKLFCSNYNIRKAVTDSNNQHPDSFSLHKAYCKMSPNSYPTLWISMDPSVYGSPLPQTMSTVTYCMMLKAGAMS